jgi:hypothetical protein
MAPLMMDAAEIARLREEAEADKGIGEPMAITVLSLLDALDQARKERDDWRERESETQEALQAIGDEFGVHGGEPRTAGIRRVLTELRAQRDQAQKDAKDARALIEDWLEVHGIFAPTLRARIEAMLEQKP